jgi:hypothetical protein
MGEFIKKAIIGSFIFFFVKMLFRRPLLSLCLGVCIYFGGRYMIFNHPDMVSNGLRAVKEEVQTVGKQIHKVTVNATNGLDN